MSRIKGEKKSVTILDKTYKLLVKDPESKLGIEKSGDLILSEKAIEWTVVASSDSGFLDTCVFENDLTNVGEYVTGSMKITYNPEGGGGTNTITPTDPYDTANKKIIYTFVKDGGNSIQSPATIKFKTKLTDEQFMAYQLENGIYKYKPTVIKNTATLKKGTNQVSKEAKVTWNPMWAAKQLVPLPDPTDPTNINKAKYMYDRQGSICYITWKIVVNDIAKAPLNNVKIVDTLNLDIKDTLDIILPKKLEYVSSQLKLYSPDNDKDATSTNDSPTHTVTGNKYTFTVGNITGKAELYIKLKVTLNSEAEAQEFMKIRQTLKNEATITWDDNAGIGVLVKGEGTVGDFEIEKRPITKYVSVYKDNNKDSIPYLNYDTEWKVTVSKANIVGDTKVYDMMIFDKNVLYDTLKTAGNLKLDSPSGDSKIDNIDLNTLVPNENGFRQRFVENSFRQERENNLRLAKHQLFNSGDHIGDLIVVSGFDATDIDNEAKRTFYLKSYLQNFSVAMNNEKDPQSEKAGKTTSWTNKVYLAKNGKLFTQATSWPRYMTRMLKKEALTRDAAVAFNVADASTANGAAVTKETQDQAFNYTDKTATYRLSVNANKVHDLGDLVVTDTLPEGWDLVSYSVFKGNSSESSAVSIDEVPLPRNNYKHKLDGLVKASGDAVLNVEKTNVATEYVSEDTKVKALYSEATKEINFTFPNISESYVIILKAKVSDEKFKTYVKNGNNIIENTAKLKFADYTKEISEKQSISIYPKVMLKNKLYTTPAELKWQLDYVPYNLVNETEAYIEDMLNPNLEIRQGATKNSLIFKNPKDNDGKITKNFQIFKLRVDKNGDLHEEEELDDAVVEKSVSYDSDARKLRFEIPNGELKNAYRFYYITDLVGEVNDKIVNSAKLMATQIEQKDPPKAEYTIQKQDVEAMASKRAFIEVTKTDNSGNPLKGAKFTITNKEGTTLFTDTKETGENGIARFQGMGKGEYTLKETQAPSGYKLNPTEYTVKVEEIVGTGSNVKIAHIEGKLEGDPRRITVVNEAFSGSSSSSSKPKPPVTTPPETTKPPETTPPVDTPPAETPPVVTPETPSPSTPTPPGESGYPRYPRAEVPDPNDPSSSDIITLIDENGVPLGNYQKQKRPDGTMEYVLMDEDVPLVNLLPKTDGQGYLSYLYLMTGASMVVLGLMLFALAKKRRKEKS